MRDNVANLTQQESLKYEASNPKQNNRYTYSVISEIPVKTADILDFVPITTKEKKKIQYNDIFSNEIPLSDKSSEYNYKKKKVGLFGSKPSSGFRSSSSRGGYHASTSPENFFKKKYASAHLKKAQRKVLSGSLSVVPKSELFQHIIVQYRKGGIRQKKKKLMRRKHRRHRSKFIQVSIKLGKNVMCFRA